MNKSRKLFLLIILVLLTDSVLAQSHRYMVFFSDKSGSEFSIANPTAFLSERAVQRREKHNFPVSEVDLPVNVEYVNGLREIGVDVYFTSKWMNAALVQMSEDMVSQINALTFTDSVRYIAEGLKLSDTQIPVDIPDVFRELQAVNNTTLRQLGLLNVDDMHEDGYKGEGVLIAVFDDGFQGINEFMPFKHLFEEDQILGWRDYIENSGNVFRYDDHGSASLSTIAASYDEVSGTAPNASYLLCVTEDIESEYRIEEYNWLLAAEYADSAGADVISGSLGYSTFDDPAMNYTYEDMNGKTTIVSRAAKMASDRGIIVVVSAGNEGNKSWKYITSPADAENILAVGSVARDGILSAFSSRGPTSDGRIKPDVVAMGQGTTIFVYSSGEGSIQTGSGTSFAAPQIAGFSAGILQANPAWTNLEVMSAIKNSANNSLTPDSLYGYGIPNYNIAVDGGALSVGDIPDDMISIYPNPFKENTLYLRLHDKTHSEPMVLTVSDSRGSELLIREIAPKEWDLTGQLEIKLSSIDKGMYILKLASKNFTKTVKLIRQ